MVEVKGQFRWIMLWWYVVAETVKIINFCHEIDGATELETIFLIFSPLVIKINLGIAKAPILQVNFIILSNMMSENCLMLFLKNFLGRYCYLLQWVAQSRNGSNFISELSMYHVSFYFIVIQCQNICGFIDLKSYKGLLTNIS